MADGYEVLTAELDANAGRVDGFADRLRAAVDAARTVSMDDGAFGVICQPFAMLLNPFEQMGVGALSKAVETVAEQAGTLRQTARVYDSQEGAQTARFGEFEV